MKIGILKTGHPSGPLQSGFGDYGIMFTKLLDGQDFDFQAYSVEDGELPASVHDADGWLITGSRHGAYEDHPWIKPLEEFLRKAYSESVPIVGICFGHQILAQALGGKVEKFKGGWSVGATEYDFEGRKLTLNAWHQDQVVKRPEGATVIGSSAFCENAFLAYGDKALTIQPHPEYQSDFIDGLIEYRGKGVVPDTMLKAARERLALPNSNAWMAARIAEFFKQPRG
ncbi:MAG: type 1 glutamine amidotransferase [Rhodobacteraceae bacterium]|nr:type 1 glutamine amidotransferase [Paracoccaceae bacterium]